MIALTGIPQIETPRLVLRGPRTGDYDACKGFLMSDRARHVGGPVKAGQAWRAFCHLTGHWVHRGYSMFIFADRQTDEPLGMSGPWFPDGWPEPELAWSVWSPRAEGKGYAHEAALAARGFAYGTLGWTTAISLIDPQNTRSEALARRMGCVPEGAFSFDTGEIARIWRHPGPAAPGATTGLGGTA